LFNIIFPGYLGFLNSDDVLEVSKILKPGLEWAAFRIV
jgi:hypothetical protein